MGMKKTDENKVIKAIRAGQFKDQYLVYSRKSTDDTDNQRNSIAFQKSGNRSFAASSGLPVADVTITGFASAGFISEKHSAFKQGETFEVTKDGRMIMKIERPKFQKLMYFLNEGYIKGVILYSWDRASRNEADGVALKKLIKRGVDIRFVTTDYDKNSSGALHMDIDDMFSQHHSRVTREKVTEAMKKLRTDGKCTYRAPIGYLNEGNVDLKPHDPERAPLIRRTAEMYATGEWTYHSLAKWCNEQGMTTFPMRRKRTTDEMRAEEEDEVVIEQKTRPITYNHVARWLSNPFYMGLMLDANGQWIESTSHEAVIPPDLWHQVASVRAGNTVSVHYAKKLPLPYRGLIRCGGSCGDDRCERSYCPYVKKGITYYGLRCKPGCSNKLKSFNLPFLEHEIGVILGRLYFTPEECEQLDRDVRGDLGRAEARRAKQLGQIESKKKALRTKLAFLRSEKLSLLSSGAYTPEEYLAEEHKLDEELSSLRSDEEISDDAMAATVKEVCKLSELLKTLGMRWNYLLIDEKERIARLVFFELWMTGNVLEFSCTSGFKPIETRLSAMCEPIAWLSELIPARHSICLLYTSDAADDYFWV